MADMFVFGKGVNVTRLNREIIADPAITPKPTSITARSGLAAIDVTINFPSSLSAPAADALSGVVSGHIPIPVFRPGPSNVTTVNGLSGAISINVSEDAVVSSQQIDDLTATIDITTGIPSASGELLAQNTQDIVEVSGLTGGGVFGQGAQRADSEGVSATSSSSFQQKLRMTTTSLPSGIYHIGWSFEEKSDDESNVRETFRVQLDDSIDLANHGGIMGSENEKEYHPNAGFKCEVLSAGVHTVDIDFRGNNNETVRIRKARLEIWRIS